MIEFLKTLLWMSAGGSAMGLILLLFRGLFRKKLPAAVFYAAWLPVLLRFVLPIGGLIQTGEAVTEQTQPTHEYTRVYTRYSGCIEAEASYGLPARSGQESYTESYPAVETEELIIEAASEKASAPVAEKTKAPATSPVEVSMLKMPEFWFCIWLLGAVVSFGYQVVSYLIFSRSLRKTLYEPSVKDMSVYHSLALSSRLRVAKSASIEAPMTFGLFKPLLILPAEELSPAVTENVIRHELIHFKRHDIIIKWFACTVFALHWFNPLCLLFSHMLDTDCELSCDEQLMHGMDEQRRRSYGETLLLLAERSVRRRLSAVTGFASEKRALKERIQNIMNTKIKSLPSVLAVTLLLTVLLICTGFALGPAEAENEAAAPTPESMKTIRVENVDELISAIASDTLIELKPGDYELTGAKSYGKDTGNKNVTWRETFDGYELVISGVKNLNIIGSARDEVKILTSPRYANVIVLEDAENVCLESFVAGHSDGEGYCTGGVIYLDSVTGVGINDCELYGCGTFGVQALNSKYIYVDKSLIRDCSYGAVEVSGCEDIRFTECEFYGNSYLFDWTLFTVDSCTGFALVNCDIHDNSGAVGISSGYSMDVSLLGCRIHDNNLSQCFFAGSRAITVEGCSFENNSIPTLIGALEYLPDAKPLKIQNLAGEELGEEELLQMVQSEAEYTKPEHKKTEIDPVELAGGGRLVTVKTVDELLAAIAPDTTIVLDAELFSLDTASDYGGVGGDYYYWTYIVDGPSLVITGVDNFNIVGPGADECEIVAIPRYADVLYFENCKNVSLSGFKAGHLDGAGSCTGDVLEMIYCEGFTISDCKLYGCGYIGINMRYCAGFEVTDTEIYDCSGYALDISSSDAIRFTYMNIHDCGEPNIIISYSEDVSLDNVPLTAGNYNIVSGEAEEYRRENPGVATKEYLLTTFDGSKGPNPNGFYYINVAGSLECKKNKEAIEGYSQMKMQSLVFDPEADFVEDTFVEVYEDSSIIVLCWKEMIDGRVCSFAEIKIEDPSQLRHQGVRGTGDEIGTMLLSEFSAQTNAVIALSGDLAAFHNYSGRDTLYIDLTSGDFIPVRRGSTESQTELESFVPENDCIMLNFGPVLVENGEALELEDDYDGLGEPFEEYSRAAIAQVDELHYLFVTVSHSPDGSTPRATVNDFAKIVASKGVQTAYNLDGGQTAEIYFNGKPFNRVDWDTERAMSDCLIFTTLR